MLPEMISLQDAFLLVATSTAASMMTAAMGIGGGLLLLAVMASIVPVAALIPVHGLVQLGSNGNRAAMTRRHIDWRLVRLFLAGAVVGAIIAALLVVQLPLMVIQLTVAVFILFMVWGPKLSNREATPSGLVTAGGVTTLISMFVGATGPLVAAYIHRQGFEKYRTVATLATCMTFQHSLKLFVFAWAGFVFVDWIALVLAMVGGGFFGTWIGLHLLRKIPTEKFQLIFKLVVSVLALRLIWQAFIS
ncbi:MAG: sulfite exporter TauE/SafE family protein [Amphritea sp.]